MPTAPVPLNESARLSALRRAEILDTAPEAAFDELTALAAYICQTPMSTVTIIDNARQWFKSRIGMEEAESSLDVSFCAHAILDDAPTIVRDATKDPRFSDYRNVIGAPNIRFYAGVPLRDRDNFALGTLCVVDHSPRDLDPAQERALSMLASQAARHLELRRLASQLREALSQVKELSQLLPICAWCKRIRDEQSYWSSVDAYLARQFDATITHGICPECLIRLESDG